MAQKYKSLSGASHHVHVPSVTRLWLDGDWTRRARPRFQQRKQPCICTAPEAEALFPESDAVVVSMDPDRISVVCCSTHRNQASLSILTVDAVIVQHYACCARYHRTPLSVATEEDSSYLKICSSITIEANGAACENISKLYHLGHSFVEAKRCLATVSSGPCLAVESGPNTRTTPSIMKEFAISNARYSYTILGGHFHHYRSNTSVREPDHTHG